MIERARPYRIENDALKLRFHQQDHTVAAALYSPNNRNFIESIIPEFYGFDLNLECATF
jgi:hypothetical protein